MVENAIGVLDSGAGGVAVLRHAVKLLGNENFIFYGDTGNSPYGEKSLPQIREITLRAADVLLGHNVKAIVVACNTATSAAIDLLRKKLPVPVIGVEPALKPACAAFPAGRIAVMATPATLHLSKYAALREKYAKNAQVISLPCPGLSKLIEQCGVGDARIYEYLDGLFSDAGGNVDAVVVGCTHYSFITSEIQRCTGGAAIFDGAYDTAKHLRDVLIQKGLLSSGVGGQVEYYTSGTRQDIEMFRSFYTREGFREGHTGL